MHDLELRPATLSDVPHLERRCWRGGEAEMRRRVREQGTCSIVAFDAGRPVAQLYLRTYVRGFRSANGIYDGAWWADLAGVEDRVELAPRTAMLGCWHVGRVRDADGTEREAPEYRGRGVGQALLEAAIEWLRTQSGVSGLAAKACDSDDRGYLGFVGGLPRAVFEALGFECRASFEDPYFAAAPDALPEDVNVEHPARFHLVEIR